MLVGWDPDSKPRSAAAAPAVREIVSLRCGENIVSYMPQEGDVCHIEFLGARGICRVGVGAHKARVLTIPPYVTDVTELLDCGENEITVSVDNNAECTACLRITSAGSD